MLLINFQVIKKENKRLEEISSIVSNITEEKSEQNEVHTFLRIQYYFLIQTLSHGFKILPKSDSINHFKLSLYLKLFLDVSRQSLDKLYFVNN